jgi:hypothetical protein
LRFSRQRKIGYVGIVNPNGAQNRFNLLVDEVPCEVWAMASPTAVVAEQRETGALVIRRDAGSKLRPWQALFAPAKGPSTQEWINSTTRKLKLTPEDWKGVDWPDFWPANVREPSHAKGE